MMTARSIFESLDLEKDRELIKEFYIEFWHDPEDFWEFNSKLKIFLHTIRSLPRKEVSEEEYRNDGDLMNIDRRVSRLPDHNSEKRLALLWFYGITESYHLYGREKYWISSELPKTDFYIYSGYELPIEELFEGCDQEKISKIEVRYSGDIQILGELPGKNTEFIKTPDLPPGDYIITVY